MIFNPFFVHIPIESKLNGRGLNKRFRRRTHVLSAVTNTIIFVCEYNLRHVVGILLQNIYIYAKIMIVINKRDWFWVRTWPRFSQSVAYFLFLLFLPFDGSCHLWWIALIWLSSCIGFSRTNVMDTWGFFHLNINLHNNIETLCNPNHLILYLFSLGMFKNWCYSLHFGIFDN